MSTSYTHEVLSQLLAGSDRINEMAAFISRIKKLLFGLLDKNATSAHNGITLAVAVFGSGERLEISSTEEGETLVVLTNGGLKRTIGEEDSIPLRIVPELFKQLPHIVASVAAKVSGVEEDLNFLLDLAPTGDVA